MASLGYDMSLLVIEREITGLPITMKQVGLARRLSLSASSSIRLSTKQSWISVYMEN